MKVMVNLTKMDDVRKSIRNHCFLDIVLLKLGDYSCIVSFDLCLVL
ncbi:hypothetical protein [Thomasclavelia cocleata]|nr:hypothetical protein [Thomasclavelia cocleata]